MKPTKHQLAVAVALLLEVPFAIAVPDAQVTQSQGGLGGAIQQQIEKQLPAQNALPAPGPEAVAPKSTQQTESDVKVLVKAFRIEGAKSIDESEIQKVLEAWLNKNLSMAELQDAADAVSKLYADKGLFAKAFFPPQSISSDGVLLLKIIEAKFGSVKVNPDDKVVRTNHERAAAYIYAANPKGGLVNTKKIEQAVYLLEELPGVDVKTELQSGDQEGEVDLLMTLRDKPLVTGSFIASNYGNASTGKEQGLLTLNLNNFSGYGDLLSVNGLRTEGTTFGKLAWQIPLGFDGLKLGINYSTMDYSTIKTYSGYEGKSNTQGINLSYPLLRSATTNFNTMVSFENKNYSNKSATTGITISDYSVKDFTATFSGNHYDSFGLGGVSYGSVSLTQGRWENSNSDSSTTYGLYNPKNFSKLNFSLTRNQQIIENQMILSVSVSGQLANKNLDSVEKFYLGGPNGVRAFPSAQGSGDEGFMLNVELQQQLQQNIVGYAFFDTGRVRQYKNSSTYSTLVQPNTTNASNQYSLSGAGVGVRMKWLDVDLNGAIAWPIGKNPLYSYSSTANSYVQQNNDGKSGSPYLWLQANYAF